MSNFLNVALNVSTLSVPQLINRARQISDAIANNPGVFTTPSPSITVVNSAINDLELAWNDAADGGKSKVAFMHTKKRDVLKQLRLLAKYVEYIAGNDEETVIIATLDLKAKPVINKPDFEVFLPDDRGAVGLRCKARAKTFYRWEYCKDPMANNPFVTGNITNVSNSFIGNLESGQKYWFRVVLVTVFGEHVLDPEYIIPL